MTDERRRPRTVEKPRDKGAPMRSRELPDYRQHPLVDRVSRKLPRPLQPAWQLTTRTVADAAHDRITTHAAGMAFYLLLSIPPLLIALAGTLGLIGMWVSNDWQADLAAFLLGISKRGLTDSAVDQVVAPTLDAFTRTRVTTVLSLGFVVAVISASRALRVTLDAIHTAYDLPHARPGLEQRVLCVLATTVAVALAPVALPALIAGPRLGHALEGLAPALLDGVGAVWQTLYWPVGIAAATLTLATVYHLGVPWDTPWRRDLPGAVLATAGVLAGTAGLRTYAAYSVDGNLVSAALAGPILLLIWLFLISLAVLIGAELNAEIERLWPTKARSPDDGDATTSAADILPPTSPATEPHDG